jgi:hypothetical protein
VRDSLLPALKKRATDQKSSAPKWHLNSIGVGVGLSGNFGLGPIINVTLSPQIKLVFTNSKNPVYPN